MSKYRLHIDIPLADDEDKAIEVCTKIMSSVIYCVPFDNNINQINYRLGHDDDRQKSNYLDKNENGHVSNKKIRITI